MDASVLRMLIFLRMLMLGLAQYQVAQDPVYPENEVFSSKASSSLLAKFKTSPEHEAFDRVFTNKGERSSSPPANIDTDYYMKEVVLPNAAPAVATPECFGKCIFHCIPHIFDYKKCFNRCDACFNRCDADCEIANRPPQSPMED